MTNVMCVKRFRQSSIYCLIVALWELVEGMIQCKITYNEVICGFDENLFANYITNITAFIVYNKKKIKKTQ